MSQSNQAAQNQHNLRHAYTISLFLFILSSVVLGFFNVCLKILFEAPQPHAILGGLWTIAGVVSPNLGNSLLILLLRMLLVIIVMPALAKVLYPPIWSDIKHLIYTKEPFLWLKIVGSSFFLFLSQVLIYLGISHVPIGVAITLFYGYPVITTLGTAALFKTYPSRAGFLVLLGILLGLGLAAHPSFATHPSQITMGILAAIGSSITFAIYVLLTQITGGKLHPVPFSLVNFAAIFIFSAMGLILLPFSIQFLGIPADWGMSFQLEQGQPLGVGCVILGVLTVLSYVMNHYAMRLAGGALASVVSASGPAVTSLLGWWILGEQLQGLQWFGVATVTLSVAAISFGRLTLVPLSESNSAAQSLENSSETEGER